MSLRALITGINGFAGGHLAEHLIDSGGWDLWGMALEDTLRLPHLATHVHLLAADMTDADAVRRAVDTAQPDVVFHLAGQSFVPASFRDPAHTLTTNTLSTLHLLHALHEQQHSARVLVVGSAEVYGAVGPDDLPIGEETPLRPLNPYAVSKIAQDMLALQYHLSYGMDIVRVRPFNHIGPRQSDAFVASSFARQIAEIEHGVRPPVLSVGNLSAQRDFTDVRDMVYAYALAVQSGIAGQVYNLGSGTPVPIQDVLDILLNASTATIEVQHDPARMRPSDIPLLVCNPSAFQQRTDWLPRHSLTETLYDILNDWRNRIAGGFQA